MSVAVQLNVDPRRSDEMVRGTVQLPKGTGKKVTIAVFAQGAKAEEAKAAGGCGPGRGRRVHALTRRQARTRWARRSWWRR